MSIKLDIYTKPKSDNSVALSQSVGKSIVIDSATSFYTQLEAICSDEQNIQERHTLLRNVFRRVIEQTILDCHIAFVGLFAKLDYCLKENNVPYNVASLIQRTRRELFPERNKKSSLTDDMLAETFPHNLKATAYLVYHLCGKEQIPHALKEHFPTADRKDSWGTIDEHVIRAIVEKWDNTYIWATEEENNTTLQICYGKANEILTGKGKFDWDYLSQILWVGAQINLVRVRKAGNSDTVLPELIILEPDFLVNVTTIAGCFETYAESPFVNLINKIKPQPNTRHIHLGNFAGRLLDEAIHGTDLSFADSLKAFVKANALSMVTCSDLKTDFNSFLEDAKIQKRNIDNIIYSTLPHDVGNYDKRDVLLEPTFFSEVLGIQGRLDFLLEQPEGTTIIEQKSGKGDFVPYSSPAYSPDTPTPKEQHIVQLLLYRALFNYEFQRYSSQLKHMMLLYSKYSKGLLDIGGNRDILHRAIKLRNLIAWSEIMYAKEGVSIITGLTPDTLNQKHVSGTLWNNYTRPELQRLLQPLSDASELELAYYLRFMRFIENETLMSKLGNKLKENSGFASIWHDTLDDKKATGNIYDELTISDFKLEGNAVTSVTMSFHDTMSADATNFRIGDIVILYPYKESTVPNACAWMVHRGTIEDIKEDHLVLRLRNSQTDKKVFDKEDDTILWAIEHDMFESSSSSIYSTLHGFLSAPKRRRDLVLSQRQPEVDPAIGIKGEYGAFNDLVNRAKQSRDLFLIIGPPGTGKTSYGLVYLLKEELLKDCANVLLLSYTNRAVDEICSKLVELKSEDPAFDFIRVGSELSCSKEYREYLLCNRASTGNDMNTLIKNIRVFCGTTASLNGNISLFRIKQFSLAIVDEASQILEPHLIGLLGAQHNGQEAISRFVLIGDHKQLPAVVQQPQDESVVTEPILNDILLYDCRLSLFERLLKQFKKDHDYDERYVYMLTKQGRMHKDIAEFPNYAFYGNKLDIVPLDHQLLPNPATQSDNGIIQMLSRHRIAFVASELPKRSQSSKTNPVEATMIAATVHQIYQLNKEHFDKDKTVGVIVPYRNQISTVRNAIDKYKTSVLHDITIDTVERYQGSQRDYIIYGFTIQEPYQLNFLTNNVFEEDGMVIDRKLNVAMTRARLNLVLIGNPILLNENFTFYKLMEFVRSKGGFFSIPQEDYCHGNFIVPERSHTDGIELLSATPGISDKFISALNSHVITPLRNDARTILPELILGNNREANMALINYGRIDFSNELSLFNAATATNALISEEDQVRLYCYYIMKPHYISAKTIYSSCRNWLSSIANEVNGRVKLIDIGCGPGTCCIAFQETMIQECNSFSYLGIDVSQAMNTMAKALIEDVAPNTYTRFAKSFMELDDAYWDSEYEVPTLVIFNFSYFFSKVDTKFTESLANRILTVMKRHPLNKYVFIIQHSEADNQIRSYVTFKKILSSEVTNVKSGNPSFTCTNDITNQALTFCYDIWRA